MKLRYRLLLAGTSAIAITAAAGIDTILISYNVAATVAAVILFNAALRYAFIKTAVRFGCIHPELEAGWPRLPWRSVQIIRKTIIEKYEELFVMGKKSTGGFTPTLSTLLLQHKSGYEILGRARVWGWPWVQYVSVPIKRHLMVLGATGGGKSNYLANLIAYTPLTASMFIVDPKGSFSRTVLAAKHKAGANVYVIDVLGNAGVPPASINPIRIIAEINALTGKDYTTIMVVGICKALIPQEKFEKPFFHNKAVEIMAAIILHELTQDPDTDLVKICHRIFSGYSEEAEELADAQNLHLQAMADNPAFDGFISAIAVRALATDHRTFSSIMATATAPLMWLMHKQTKDFIVRHDVSLLDLKSDTRKVIIALACPPFELRTTYAGYFRMMVFIVLKIMEFIPGNLKERTRIVLEEMGTIGAIDGLPEVWPLLRGFGGYGIGVVQEIEALRRFYPNHWRTILANSDATLFFQTEDAETIEYLCDKVLGSKSHDGFKQPVLEPEQAKRFLAYQEGRGGNCIVARSGKRPLALRMVEYFRDAPVWLYEPDPEHGDTPARAWFRQWLKERRPDYVPPFPGLPAPEIFDADRKLNELLQREAASRRQQTPS